MKVALINPKGNIFGKNSRMHQFLHETKSMDSFRLFWSAPCLGLLTIASYIDETWEIKYIDENFQQIDLEETFDFVALSVMTVQAKRAYEISDYYRSRNILTVIGGIHATILPEEAMQHADVVLQGEGEVLFPRFLEDLKNGCVKSRYQEDNRGSFGLRECIPPRYDLIRDYEYPLINIYTTRGCPRKCNFCCASSIFGEKYRRKLNQEILKEIDIVKELYPEKMILFADDNFFVQRKESKELLRQMIGRDVRWIAQTDIAIAYDEELLELMYEAGCQWIVIGFESVSKKSLGQIESGKFKQSQIDNYSSSIQKIQSFGIQIYGTFIVGLDEDPMDIFQKTTDFIIENSLYGANITVPTPLPGTKLRQDLLNEDRITNYEWDNYTFWDVVVKPKSMTCKQLEDGLYSAYVTLSNQENVNRRLKSLLKNRRNQRKKKIRVDD